LVCRRAFCKSSTSHFDEVYSARTILCPDTCVVFQTAILSILVVTKTKGHQQTLTAKPATAFPESVYIIVILSYVYAGNCSLNRVDCDCCLFADFLMVRALIVKNYQIKLLK